MKYNYGFSTVLTEDWLSLAKVFIDSILYFSKYPITINCLNFDHNFKHDRVVSRRIDINPLNWNTVCMTKWIAMNEMPYDSTLMVDCDMIALPDVDSIFETNQTKLQQSEFPLFCKHPHNPFEDIKHKNHLQQLINIFTNNKPKMKYVYAHGLFNKKHKWFIAEFLSLIEEYLSTGIPFCGDEGLLNILLTKHQLNQDIGYNYAPNTSLSLDYINNSISDSKQLYESYLQFNCPVKFYLLHGCKNPTIAKSLLQQIKNKT
jgi:hypothetical protein